MTAHAILSASGSSRWLKCTPSAQLEQQFPNETSEYAAEGTFAHTYAELTLSRDLGFIDSKTYSKRLKVLEGNEFFTQALVDYVQGYVDFCHECINNIRSRSKASIILLEHRLDFSQWVPRGFGTGDLVLVADGTLDVIDLKYGKGIPVSAEDNPQMKLYALGALSQFDCLYDIHKVRMTICQPRLDSISTAELSVDELTKWADEYLKPKAEQAIAGEGEFAAGDHCRFCRARFTCRARAEANLELAKMDFQKPPLLTQDEVAEVLAKADQLQKWAADVQAYALDQAENHGVKWPGWKLVEGRSNRKYTDEPTVAKLLIAADYKEEAIYKPKELLGITAMEKEIGKKKFSQLLSELVVKPVGKPTLVPESDKRPEINSTDAAKADFSEAV